MLMIQAWLLPYVKGSGAMINGCLYVLLMESVVGSAVLLSWGGREAVEAILSSDGWWTSERVRISPVGAHPEPPVTSGCPKGVGFDSRHSSDVLHHLLILRLVHGAIRAMCCEPCEVITYTEDHAAQQCMETHSTVQKQTMP